MSNEKIQPRPNIAQLEAMLNETEDGEIEIAPDGTVIRLGVIERMEKNLRLEREKNAALQEQIKRLRRHLEAIQQLAGAES